MAAPSLQTRLALRLAAVCLLALAAAVGGLGWRAFDALDSLDDRALQSQAGDIARHLAESADGTPRLDLPDGLRAAYARSGGTYLFAVYDADGRILASSGAEAERRLAVHPSAADERFFAIPDDGAHGPYYAYATRAGTATVVVAQGRLHDDVMADSIAEEFAEDMVWWLIPVVAATLWVGVATIRSSLAPLTRASQLAARIGPGTPGLRLPEQDLPREVLPLVQAVNGALDRLQRGFEAQRRFTADAAHELRTPLAVLTARVDALDGAAPAELRRDVDRINRVVGQLLSVARLDAASPDVSRRIDLRRVAAEAAGALAPLAVRERRTVALDGTEDPVWVRGDAAALTVALTNLIENALAHTPPETAVTVTVEKPGAVTVRDRGPGVPADEREVVFDRFRRGRDVSRPGAGLGLAIVRETVRAHGGTVEVGDAAGGGAAFTVRLPAAAVSAPLGSRDHGAHEVLPVQ